MRNVNDLEQINNGFVIIIMNIQQVPKPNKDFNHNENGTAVEMVEPLY